MGYTTEFEGRFQLSKPLTDDQENYLIKFSESRRMKRNVLKLKDLIQKNNIQPLNEKVNLPFGIEGEFFVDGLGDFGQDQDESIINYNNPPYTQPGLWCCWTPANKSEIEWNGAEKFYEYINWIKYMIKNFFIPWNINLNGTVQWYGEERNDVGSIIIQNNVVSVEM